MTAWLWILLLTALAAALYKLAWQNRLLRELADSFDRDTLFLLPTQRGFYGKSSCRRLTRSINRLIEENRRLRGEHAGQVGQLRATLESMQEAVLIVDRDNQVVLANRACQKMFPQLAQTKRKLEQALPNPAFLEFVAAVRDNRHSPNREIEFSRRENRLWVEATGSIIPGLRPEGPDVTLLVLHNITRLKQLESLRRDFVANVSHELRTPLSMIKGYVETLADEDATLPPDKRQKFLTTVRRHTDRLVLLLEDLLTLSRLESRTRPLQREVLYLESLGEALRESYRNRLDEHRHTLVFDFAPQPAPVFADPSKILQVFENLLQNAVKYSPDQSRIILGTRVQGDQVAAWVADNGTGISAADLPRIFERFYRVDKGRSREKGGTGLGLSIVKHVVQLHGGTLQAHSKVGEGTTIGFKLPACKTPDPA